MRGPSPRRAFILLFGGAIGFALLGAGASGCRKAGFASSAGAAKATVTVLIDGRTAGAAFVAERIGTSAWLATDPRAVPDGSEVRVRFGLESPRAAELAWRSEEEGLAILHVRGEGLPEPVRPPISASPSLESTAVLIPPSGKPLPVTVFGAPAALEPGSATEVEGDARTGASQSEPILRLSGAIDRSLSGGPILSPEGRLLGMASIASKEAATVVPASRLKSVLRGRAARFEVRELSTGPGVATLEVEVSLLDPSSKIDRVSFQLRAKATHPAPPVPTPGHEISLRAGVFAVTSDITLTNGRGRALVRARGPATDEEYWAELYFRNAAGNDVVAPPVGLTVHFSGSSGSGAAGGGSGGEETKVQFPSPVSAIWPASNGKLVVIALRGDDTLKVWETAGRRVLREIRLPSANFVVAAGGETALVSFAENELLCTYDLATGEKRVVSPNPFPDPVVRVAMGAGNGEAAVVWVRSRDWKRKSAAFLLDLRSLKPRVSAGTPVQLSEQRFSDHQTSNIPNSALTLLTEWIRGLSPNGVGLYRITGEGVQAEFEHDSKGWLSPGDDNRIYTSSGQILDSKLKVQATVPGKRLLAGSGGVFYLGIGTDGSLDLFVSGSTTSVASLGKHPGNPDETTTFLLGSEGKLVLLGKENRSLVQRGFDVAAALSAAR